MSNYSASDICQRATHLETERGQWDTVWQQVADFVAPRKSQITDIKTPDIIGYTDDVYDTEAIHSALTLASGQMDYLVGGEWFQYEAPTLQLREDREAANWYKECSEEVLYRLNGSNFQLMQHEFFHDRAIFGTAHEHLDEDDDDVFCFKNYPVGYYSIVENHKSQVSEVYYKLEYTARQAVERFGLDNLSKPIRDAFASDDTKQKEKKFKFIHAVYERTERDVTKENPENKRWASIYVEEKAKTIVKESGFDEQPFAVSRYLKWQNTAYGYSPAIEALPSIRQVNFIERHMDALAELAAFPRILIPESHEGEIDFRANGVTTFDPNNPNAVPKEWATQGRYDIGVERARVKRDIIRRAFHVDLFQLLTNFDELKREKTAYEVAQMMSEKITRISPTFERIKTEVFKPILSRAFAICFRRGLLPPPPGSVRIGDEIEVPSVSYTGKLALAVKSVENQKFVEFMNLMAPLMQLYPDSISREINPDRTFRRLGTNTGIAAEMWNTQQEKDAVIKQQQAQAQAERAAMATQNAQAMMAGAGALGQAPKEIQDKVTSSL